MSGVIDTNLLLYAVNREAPEHPIARSFLQQVQNDPGVWYLTDGLCYEFLRVATHPRVFPAPLKASEALEFLDVMMAWPSIAILRPGVGHWQMLRQVLSSLHNPHGNLLHDIRTATLMREHGVRRIYTADTDFLQFQEIEVVNPLQDAAG